MTGRHEHRYRRLYARWNRFLADVLNLSLHATEVEVSVEECGKMVMEIDHTFDRPEVLEKFRRDWKTGSVSLETVFHHTSGSYDSYLFSFPQVYANNLSEKTLKYLSMYPTPIFQKLLLLDLPPELVHYVMFVATSGDARRLGSTSKYFRKISLSYIYTVSHRLISALTDLMLFDSPARLTYHSNQDRSFQEPQKILMRNRRKFELLVIPY